MVYPMYILEIRVPDVCENLKINEENLPVLQVYLVILDVLAMFLCHDVCSLQRAWQNLAWEVVRFFL
jgi:hypothetical protein